MIIYTILLMSLLCIGVFVSMQEGMILAFLREPVLNNIKAIEERYKIERDMSLTEYQRDKINAEKIIDNESREQTFNELRANYKQQQIVIDQCENAELKPTFLLKPFIICVYCFASFWGSIVFWSLHYFVFKDITYDLIPVWIISVFICVVFNAVFDSVLRKLNVYE